MTDISRTEQITQMIAKLSTLYAIRSDSLHSWDRWMEVVTDAWPLLLAELGRTQRDHSAIEQAKAALRKALRHLGSYAAPSERVMYLTEAITALEALPAVPPDREALARRLELFAVPMYPHSWSAESDRKLRETLNEAAAALRLPAGDAERWQPIETAPKDGSPLLWFGRWKPYDILTGGQPCQMIFRWSSFDSSGDPKSEAWYSDHSLGAKPDHWNVEWTYWQPLPSPPRPSAKRGETPAAEPSIADLHAELAQVQAKIARRVLGDPSVSIGSSAKREETK